MDTPFFVHKGAMLLEQICSEKKGIMIVLRVLKKGETPIFPDTVRDSADCTLHAARNVKDSQVSTLYT